MVPHSIEMLFVHHFTLLCFVFHLYIYMYIFLRMSTVDSIFNVAIFYFFVCRFFNENCRILQTPVEIGLFNA